MSLSPKNRCVAVSILGVHTLTVNIAKQVSWLTIGFSIFFKKKRFAFENLKVSNQKLTFCYIQ